MMNLKTLSSEYSINTRLAGVMTCVLPIVAYASNEALQTTDLVLMGAASCFFGLNALIAKREVVRKARFVALLACSLTAQLILLEMMKSETTALMSAAVFAALILSMHTIAVSAVRSMGEMHMKLSQPIKSCLVMLLSCGFPVAYFEQGQILQSHGMLAAFVFAACMLGAWGNRKVVMV